MPGNTYTEEGGLSDAAMEDEDDKSSEFTSVLAVVNKHEMLVLASQVRHEIHPDYDKSLPAIDYTEYGTQSIRYTLAFGDCVKWLVRIPKIGTEAEWTQAAESLVYREVETMKFLKAKTTIPLPEVFEYCGTLENEIGCPFVMMFIHGLPLYDVWFGDHLDGTSPDIVHSRRLCALEGIASAMIQLGKFTSRKYCLPGIDDEHVAVYTGLSEKFEEDFDMPFPGSESDFHPGKFFTAILDRFPHTGSVGLELLVRKLVDWIPIEEDSDSFVLGRLGFDFENFIVSQDGTILGITGWNGVAYLPRSIGDDRYPDWLVPNFSYQSPEYEDSMEYEEEPEEDWTDSPQCCAHYRGIYDSIMARHCAEERGSESKINFKQMSPITLNLYQAAIDENERPDILERIVQYIWAAAGRHEALSATDLAEMLYKGDVDPELMEVLKMGFQNLLLRRPVR